MGKNLTDSATKGRVLRGFGCVEKLKNLNESFSVNFVLLYVYLDHKKAAYISLSKKY